MIFGWLNKKAINEQKKLIWQTSAAAEVCHGFYLAKSDHERADTAKLIVDQIHEIVSVFDQNEPLDPKIMSFLFEANKQARILYEGFPNNPYLQIERVPFDKKFVPLAGWDAYLKHN